MEYRLCGGTFFTLLTVVKRPNSRKKYQILGTESEASEKSMFVALMRLLNPVYEPSNIGTLSNTVSRFKNCHISRGTDVPIDDSSFSAGFDYRLRRHFYDCLYAMRSFCQAFLMVEDQYRMQWLAKALIELVSNDPTIPDEAEFFVDSRARTQKKQALSAIKEMHLPAFMLSILDYIVLCAPNNTVGVETLTSWQALKDNKYQTAAIKSSVGSSFEHELVVHTSMPKEIPPEELLQVATPGLSGYQRFGIPEHIKDSIFLRSPVNGDSPVYSGILQDISIEGDPDSADDADTSTIVLKIKLKQQ